MRARSIIGISVIMRFEPDVLLLGHFALSKMRLTFIVYKQGVGCQNKKASLATVIAVKQFQTLTLTTKTLEHSLRSLRVLGHPAEILKKRL